MSHNGCHRLPGFSHFDFPLSSLELKFSSQVLNSNTGLDLSIVNGLDLTNSNYEGLNLSSNGGGQTSRNENNSQQQQSAQISNRNLESVASTSQSSNPQAAQQLLESGGAAFSQQLLGSGLSCSQGLEGSCSDEAEMVLNLSTQIGLNLTRPGQTVLDYTEMLGIDQDTSFTHSLQETEFEYYSGYYENYSQQILCTPASTDEQRSSPLNLEHRSSPLNLTAVGNLDRKPTTIAQRINTGFNFAFNSTPTSNTMISSSNLAPPLNPTSFSSLSNTASEVGQASIMIVSSMSKSGKVGSNSTQGKQNQTLTLNPVNNNPSGAQMFPKLASIGQPGEMIMNIIPVNSVPHQKIVKLSSTEATSSQVYNYSNQAFDYRIPNKLSAFYNQPGNQPDNHLVNQSNKPGEQPNNKPVDQTNNLQRAQKTIGKQTCNITSKQAALNKHIDQTQTSAGNQSRYQTENVCIGEPRVLGSLKQGLSMVDEGVGAQLNRDDYFGYFDPFELELEQGVASGVEPEPMEKHLVSRNGPCINSQKESSSELWCLECRIKFTEESQMISHARTVHGDKTRKSGQLPDLCRKRKALKTENPGTRALSSNVQAELNKQPYPFQCITCNDKFQFKSELLVHLDEHNQIKPFKCSVCNLGFTFQSARKRHERSHSDGGGKTNSCEECHKSFSRKSDLRNHMKTHMGARISCQHCAQMFNNEKSAAKHACSAQNPEKKYPCPLCDAALKTKVEWGAHVWKHTKDARYVVCTEEEDLPLFEPNQTQTELQPKYLHICS